MMMSLAAVLCSAGNLLPNVLKTLSELSGFWATGYRERGGACRKWPHPQNYFPGFSNFIHFGEIFFADKIFLHFLQFFYHSKGP